MELAMGNDELRHRTLHQNFFFISGACEMSGIKNEFTSFIIRLEMEVRIKIIN